MLWQLPPILLIALAGACSQNVTETIVVVDAADETMRQRAEALHVQVYDTEGTLVLDTTAAIGDGEREATLPDEVPLFPRDDLPDRRFRVVAELETSYGCILGRGEIEGGYATAESTRLPLLVPMSEPDPCVEVFVDGSSGANSETDCTQRSTPCRTIAYAVTNYARGPSRTANVVSVVGGQTYGDGPFFLDDQDSGTPDAPTTLRVVPGTGVARLTAPAGSRTIVSFNFDAEHIRLIGFEITGGAIRGVDTNRNTGIAILDNHIHGNGIGDERETEEPYAAGIFLSALSGATVAGNLIEDNRWSAGGSWRTNGIAARGHPEGVRIENNVVRGNDIGMYLYPQDMDVSSNRICDNSDVGIRGAGTGLRIQHNTLVRNGPFGFAFDGDRADLTDNLIAFHETAQVSVIDAREDLRLSNNLYFGPGAEDVLGRPASASDITGLDPLFVDAMDCTMLTLEDSSPAIGAASDETTIGAYQPQ